MSAADQSEPQGTEVPPAHPVAPESETVDVAEAPAPPRRSGLDSHGRVKRTRAATAWASAVALALVMILFVIFVVQNSRSITIDFLWMNGRISTAAALLIAAVAGSLLVGIPAAVRIGQLRRSLRRNG
ncbi:putative integral membrane protein [Marmoricola sp. OAE513]|uniref:hypothetical protein n=1 Tax=Marmoricola sp. OAE513 TaxID=2817894 RepID=UPI001AE8C2D5